MGTQIAIVVGGGNFWRGRSSGKMDRMDADKIGMLATVMNALAVKDALRQQGVDAVVMTSSFMPQVAECFTSDKAIAALESGKIVVFGLAVMDSTAATLCRDNGLPILVFDLGQPANIAKAVKGESVGTLVRE